MNICTFASGSSGNCSLVSSGDTYILVDAGISLRRIKNSLASIGLEPGQLSGVLITHEHSDHISALKMISKYFQLPIFAPCGTAEGLSLSAPEVMQYVTSFTAGDSFAIGSLLVKSFPTPHDTRESVGYRITDGEKSVSFITDLGFVPQCVYDAVVGSDTVVLESNHDLQMLKNGRYPSYLKRRISAEKGHLSNDECARLAAALVRHGTKRIILAHLSAENNTPEKAYDTVCGVLDSGHDVELHVAPRSCRGEVFLV